MRIVVRHNEVGQWWWAAVSENGATAAVSVPYGSRTDCVRGLAEMKVEGPAAQVTYEDPYAASPGTWTISSLIPSGS
jgi:uncharacterized protein YegP (UPF0339 family)